MQLYKITKLSAVKNPVVQSAQSVDEYRESLHTYDETLSPNVDYWMIGELISGPVLGESVILQRSNRNGIEMPGVFTSSIVTKITEAGFETMNSNYKMEAL